MHLTQGYLSHEKYLLHATDRITALEAELAEVRARAPADEWTRAYAGIVGGAASGRDEERGAGWSWKPRDWFKTT